MTPERQKYLAGISKEEDLVRELISIEKSCIKLCKVQLYVYGKDYNIAETMRIRKAKVALLKKHLTSPPKYILDAEICPVCNCMIYNDGAFYCPHCGQKLRCKNE